MTSTDRTTRVSSMTPSATATPSSARNTSGSDAEHQERGREHQAGRGDHPAGGRQRDQRALAGAVVWRLLAHPGHQEDVVVDAQRDQEHEHEQRERRIGARRSRTRSRTAARRGRARPRRTAPRSPIRSSGADQRPQQQHQDQQHDDQDDRDDHLVVAAGGVLDVEVDRRAAADHGVGPVDLRGPRRVPVSTAVERGLGEVTSFLQRDRRSRATPLAEIGGCRACRARRCRSRGLRDLGGLVGVGDHLHRVGAVGQAVGGEHLLPGDRVELLACRSPRCDRPVASSLKMPRQAIDQDAARCRPRPRGRGREIALPTRAQRPVAVGSRGAEATAAGQKIQRPKITSSAGSRVIMTSQGHHDADGEHRAEPGGGVQVGEQQAQHAERRRCRAGDDRRGRPGAGRTAIASWRSSWRRSSSR